jgi:hypothetical protein
MSTTFAVTTASCGRCGDSLERGGAFCEHCGTARVPANVPLVARGTGAPSLIGTSRADASTTLLAVVIDTIPVILVALAAVAVALIAGSAAWLVVGLILIVALGIAQTIALSRTGRTIGRFATGTRTVDDLSGLPLRYRSTLGAVVGLPVGAATVELRKGRDPLTPSIVLAPTSGLMSDRSSDLTTSAPVANAAPEATVHATPPRADPVSTGVSTGIAILLDSGQRVVVESSLVIGRNPATSDASAVFSWPDLSRSLSKNHAMLEWLEETLVVTDLGSTNGTKLVSTTGESTPLVAGERAVARVGWRIEFGSRTATVAEVMSS